MYKTAPTLPGRHTFAFVGALHAPTERRELS